MSPRLREEPHGAEKVDYANHSFVEAVEVFQKALQRMQILTSLLANKEFVAHYYHSPIMKRHDAAMMTLIIYVDMTYCFLNLGRVEEMFCSSYEAEEVVNAYLFDSFEARSMIVRMKNYVINGVDLLSNQVSREV